MAANSILLLKTVRSLFRQHGTFNNTPLMLKLNSFKERINNVFFESFAIFENRTLKYNISQQLSKLIV